MQTRVLRRRRGEGRDGGRLVGQDGGYPATDPQTPENLAATIYQALGIPKTADVARRREPAAPRLPRRADPRSDWLSLDGRQVREVLSSQLTPSIRYTILGQAAVVIAPNVCQSQCVPIGKSGGSHVSASRKNHAIPNETRAVATQPHAGPASESGP